MQIQKKERPDTWEFEGTQFKRCPKCSKGMPASWTQHKACGWGIEVEQKEDTAKIIGTSISYAKDLAVAGKITVEQIAEKAAGFVNLHRQLFAG